MSGEKWRSGRDLNPSTRGPGDTRREQSREVGVVEIPPSAAVHQPTAPSRGAVAEAPISACDLGLAALRAGEEP
jgi:hypothetical protein